MLIGRAGFYFSCLNSRTTPDLNDIIKNPHPSAGAGQAISRTHRASCGVPASWVPMLFLLLPEDFFQQRGGLGGWVFADILLFFC